LPDYVVDTTFPEPRLYVESELQVLVALVENPGGNGNLPILGSADLWGHLPYLRQKTVHKRDIIFHFAAPEIAGPEHEVQLDASGLVVFQLLANQGHFFVSDLLQGEVVTPLCMRQTIVCFPQADLGAVFPLEPAAALIARFGGVL